jgi:hypothetical protein
MRLALSVSLIQSLACLALALLPCCGASPPPPEPDEAAPGQAPSGVELIDAPVVLAPDLAIRRHVESWAARWSAASGIKISVVAADEPGTPVWFVGEPLWREDGGRYDGWVEPDGSRMNVYYRAKDVTLTVGHELGHLLGADHVTSGGLMSEEVNGVLPLPVIDEASLASVCERRVCTAFNPEAM